MWAANVRVVRPLMEQSRHRSRSVFTSLEPLDPNITCGRSYAVVHIETVECTWHLCLGARSFEFEKIGSKDNSSPFHAQSSL